MKKVVTFCMDNAIDIITNSSSELFTFKGDSKEIIIEMIKEVYPDYRNEYDELKHINEMSPSQLDHYMGYACSAHMWPAPKSAFPIPGNFTFEELYETQEDMHGREDWKLKNNSEERWGGFVNQDNMEWVLEKLDPERKMYFLFSSDENPDYDMQEKLMNIGHRYHLG